MHKPLKRCQFKETTTAAAEKNNNKNNNRSVKKGTNNFTIWVSK